MSAHNLVCAILALLLLPALAAILPFILGIKLEENVTLVPYGLAVLGSMLWAQRGVFDGSLDLHRLSWACASRVAVRQSVIVAGCIFTLMFAIKDRSISRLFLGAYLVLLCGLLALVHACVPSLLARWLFPVRDVTPTLLIGRGDNVRALNDWLSAKRHLGLLPVGYLGDTGAEVGLIGPAPWLGGWDRLEELIEKHQISQVILLGWVDDPAEVERIVQICEAAGCRFLIHNDYGARYARRFVPIEEGGHDFLAVQQEPLEDPLNRALKRILDVVVALPVVLCLLPVACVVVGAIQCSQAPGPLFFTMERSGWRKRTFAMLKFRSMYAVKHDVNEQASRQDRRVFPAGRVLRRMSIDELPQFWNVLRGEMSVVGPRPHLPSHDHEFSRLARGYKIRSLVKPGITGLAQVNGLRGEITDAEKLRQRVFWDLYYTRNWSLAMDLKIILRTLWHVFFPPPSAY